MSRIFELSSSYLVRKSHEEALCTIRSHGRELIMLGRKLHSWTFKTKESRAGLILVPLLCFGSPNVINSVPSDRIVQRTYCLLQVITIRHCKVFIPLGTVWLLPPQSEGLQPCVQSFCSELFVNRLPQFPA